MVVQLASEAVRFWITVLILAIILFVFEDAVLELVLGAGTEQGILIGSLEILIAFAASLLVVRRTFQIARYRV